MIEEHTLRELTTPPLNQQPLYITCPDLNIVFELKFDLFHLLPKFRGLENENPHKNLKEFHVICSSIKSQGVSEE